MVGSSGLTAGEALSTPPVTTATPNAERGITTEIALLVMYGVGAALALGHTALAVVLGATTALLLHWKEPLHRFVASLGARDLAMIMRFALIALVILPILPDQGYGPFGALNPFRIWRLVVLIVAISIGGYVVYKWLGARAGTLLGGVIGGVISSTATTVSYARRTRAEPALAGLGATVVTVASAVSIARVMVLLAVIAPGQRGALLPPLAWLLGALLLLALFALWRSRAATVVMPEQNNPAELGSALWFAGLFALITVSVSATLAYLGSGALIAVAALSGLTDLDAIALSVGRLAAQGGLGLPQAAQALVVAAIANQIFKAGTVLVLGSWAMAWRTAVYLGLAAMVAGLALILV